MGGLAHSVDSRALCSLQALYRSYLKTTLPQMLSRTALGSASASEPAASEGMGTAGGVASVDAGAAGGTGAPLAGTEGIGAGVLEDVGALEGAAGVCAAGAELPTDRLADADDESTDDASAGTSKGGTSSSPSYDAIKASS